MASRYEADFGEYKVVTIVTGDFHKENCYLVTHIPTDEKLLIDPGDNADSILENFGDNGGRPSHILLTHGHHDHVGAAAALCRHFGMACEVHEKDKRLMKQAPMYSTVFAKKKIEPPEPFVTFEGQPNFHLGDRGITVFHTPGHTSGSVCYSFGDFIFTGDTLFYQMIGRTDLPGGNADELSESIRRLINEFPETSTILPGHGRPWKISEARTWWKEASQKG